MSSLKEENNETDAPALATADGPEIPAYVNEEHFIDVIQENIPDFKKILEFYIEPTAGAGENYSAVLLRIKVKMELKDGSTKDVAYMLKTFPQNEKVAMMANMTGIFPRESAVYSKYLPEFEQMYRDAGKNVKFAPKFFTFTKNPGTDYILLEDLGSSSFKNVNRIHGLDKDHTESVLRILAELHAASAVRYETKGDYDAILVNSFLNENNKQPFEMMLKALHQIYLECLSKSEICARYLKKLKKLHNSYADNIIELSKIDPDEFNVLNHGDVWANNVMFRHNCKGKLKETIFIDFQLSKYGAPVADLYYFLLSSPKLDLKLSHFDYFIKYYYEHLIDNLELLKYSKKVPTLKDIHVQLLKYSFWGFFTISNVMAGLLLDPTDAATIENFMQEEETGIQLKMKLFGNPRYIKHMEAILPWLNTRGLLE